MNTSTMNDDIRDKSTDIVPKKHDNSILEQLQEVKKKRKSDYYNFKFSKSDKTSKETCETTTIQGQYPSNTTVIVGDSIINGIREERLFGLGSMVWLRFVIFQVLLKRICNITLCQYLREILVVWFFMLEQIMLNLVLQEKF